MTKTFSNQVIFKDFSLNIKKEEILVILGSSGVGKTTLLNILSKVDIDFDGEITYSKEVFENVEIALPVVFQEFDQLFPWFDVRKNIMLPIKKNKENSEKFKHIVKSLGLNDSINKYPIQLSGGMKQRTSIARALMCDSKVLLMDEPFGSLDFKMRKNLQDLIVKIKEDYKKTIVFITHDVEEAILIGDRVIVLKNNLKKYDTFITSSIRNIESEEFYYNLKMIKKVIQED
jgi:ABC-type nitrate/sulfonate/bicarbonate transport system ATPase subunit